MIPALLGPIKAQSFAKDISLELLNLLSFFFFFFQKFPFPFFIFSLLTHLWWYEKVKKI